MAIILRNSKGSALTHTELDANFTTLQNADLDSAAVASIAQALDDSQTILDSAAVTTLAQAAQGNIHLNTLAGDSDIDFGSNKILYANVYDSEGGLPSAATYHGMFAHVHGTGKGYYAHAGNWVKLADYADVGTGIDSAKTIDLIDSAYVNFRVDADSIGSLSNVNLSGLANNSILKYDTTTSKWIMATDQTAGGGSGIALTDLSVSVASAGSANLSYNNTTGVFQYTPPDLSSYITSIPAEYLTETEGDARYLQSYTETNDLSAAVVWANVPNSNITQSSVTQHQGALSITESQISDLGSYLTNGSSIDLNGNELILDADGDTSFHANTDDRIDIRVKGADVGYFDSTGLVADGISTQTAGTPTITSGSNINMSVGGSVTVSGGGFRVGSLSTSDRNSLAAADGEIVYNTDNDMFEVYHNSAWHHMGTPIHVFTLGANGSSDYTFTDPHSVYFPTTANDPVLYLRRGEIYKFINNSGGSHPFQIRLSSGGSAYSTGVTNNGASSGTITFKVPMDAPSTLYYQCTAHSSMGNTINIV